MVCHRIREKMRYWKRTNTNGTTRTVESYSHGLDVAGAIEITKETFDAFIAPILAQPPDPAHDLQAELNELKQRLAALEGQE